MFMSSRSFGKITSALFVGALLLYMLAGVNLAPFHGDESTIIDMGRDWYRLVVDHDLASILYKPNVIEKARDDQNLRLLNGVLSKYGIGIATSIAGIPAKDLVTGWNWGQDWYTNQYYNHIAVNPLLFIARMSSILMAMLSVAFAFRIGLMLDGPRGAFLAAFIYATLPAVLLNGRRAMFEGAFLLATALLIFAALRLAQHLRHDTRWRSWLFFGFALGLTPVAKHTALLPAIPIFVALLWLGRKHWLRTIQHMIVSLLVAGAVFLALNPAWWSQPLQMPDVVLKLRQEILNGQTIPSNLYHSTSDRVSALVNFTLGGPQYFEEQFNGPQGWQDWLRDQINAYSTSGVVGIDWSRLGIVAWVLIALGIAAMFRSAFLNHVDRARSAVALTVLAIVLFSVVAIFLITPFAWQRYYLPLSLPLAVSFASGIVALVEIIRLIVQRTRTESLSLQ
jgi:4-amino-4-deoxy-L-arabinose transferase-like glycosyltransferase